MTAAVDDTSDQDAEQPAQGPGHRLRAARKAVGMDLERLAAQLHLKPGQVEALEQDRYEDFAARVFVRGYLRNYARLVGLHVDDVLAAFDATCPDPDQPRQLRRVGTQRPQVGSGHGLVRMVSWALLLGMVALFLVWWAGYLELNGNGDESFADRGAELNPPQAEPGELLQPLGEPPAVTSAPAPQEEVVAESQAETALALPEPAATTAEEPAVDVEPALAEEDPGTAPTQPEPTAPEVLGPQMVLTLSGPCWVEIRDSSGDYRLIGNLGAGTRRVLGGEPPYEVLLGNASVAELTIDGQPVDLAPHTRAQVARFTLGADTR